MDLATGALSPAEEAGHSCRRPCCRAIDRGGHGEFTDGRVELALSPAEEARRSCRRRCCRAIDRGGHGEFTDGRMEDTPDAPSPAAENTHGH
jgi:hypothetical protein